MTTEAKSFSRDGRAGSAYCVPAALQSNTLSSPNDAVRAAPVTDPYDTLPPYFESMETDESTPIRKTTWKGDEVDIMPPDRPSHQSHLLHHASSRSTDTHDEVCLSLSVGGSVSVPAAAYDAKV